VVTSSTAPLPWRHVISVLIVYAPIWVGATVVMTVLGMGAAILKNDQWKASQPMLLRDEANGATGLRLGRFDSQTQMKAAQETILEMAKNPEVVSAALKRMGVPEGEDATTWPESSVVESIARDSINVRAPKGSEFGSTEVIYLESTGDSPEQAKKFCEAMLHSLTERLRLVRSVRAGSVIAELEESRNLASERLGDITERMQAMESQVGSDLGELRNLTDALAGDTSTQRRLADVDRDLNLAEIERKRLEQLKELLESAQNDPQRLFVSNTDLLESQPSLKRLKDGLVDAGLEAARLSGRFQPAHPRVRAAVESEKQIRESIHREIRTAINAMQPSMQLADSRIERLQEDRSTLTRRLEHLAALRSTYVNLSSEMKQRTEHFQQAAQALADAQASKQAAMATNLITAIDPPQVGNKPVGPGRSIIVGGAGAAGLALGLGIVFLIAPSPSTHPFGRRFSDYFGGRRDIDHAGQPATASATEHVASTADRATRDRLVQPDWSQGGTVPGDRRRSVSIPKAN
jgi:polysaccharide biosynthesis transport protein